MQEQLEGGNEKKKPRAAQRRMILPSIGFYWYAAVIFHVSIYLATELKYVNWRWTRSGVGTAENSGEHQGSRFSAHWELVTDPLLLQILSGLYIVSFCDIRCQHTVNGASKAEEASTQALSIL